jgi:uncharacterized protein YukE
MKKYKQRIESIDKFIEALEDMIDARDDMWEEEKYSNWRQMWAIKNEKYLPAKDRLKDALHDFVVEVIDQEEVEIE